MNDYKLGEFNLCAMDNNLTMHKTPIIDAINIKVHKHLLFNGRRQ